VRNFRSPVEVIYRSLAVVLSGERGMLQQIKAYMSSSARSRWRCGPAYVSFPPLAGWSITNSPGTIAH